MTDNIGRELHKAREDKDISLEQAAEETYIRIHYLAALERGDFSQLPSNAHIKGFLRAYSEYLGIDVQPFISQLDHTERAAPDTTPDVEEAQPPRVNEAQGSAVLIFINLGENLKKQREMLGFSLEEVERNTHVRQHYLEALESGNLEQLPSPVQGRGMLQNYATFLGLDPEPVLLQFADGLQAGLSEKQATKPISSEAKTKRRRINLPFLRSFPSDWLLGAVLIVAVIAFTIWGTIRITSMQAAPSPVETVPSIADALQTTPQGTPSEVSLTTVTQLPAIAEVTDSPGLEENPIPPPAGEAPQETAEPIVSDSPVQIYVSILRRAWMRVIVDENIEFEGRVIPGSAYTFSGDFQIELLTGNGAALQVFFNNTDLGVLGVYGEVVYKVFTPEGELLPTPTATQIPTSTPVASPTPLLTETP